MTRLKKSASNGAEVSWASRVNKLRACVNRLLPSKPPLALTLKRRWMGQNKVAKKHYLFFVVVRFPYLKRIATNRVVAWW
jgi:hypothetical protein